MAGKANKKNEELASGYQGTGYYDAIKPDDDTKINLARTFGNVFGRFLEEKGLSQASVERRSCVSYRSLDRYKDNRIPQDRRIVIQIAMGLLLEADERDKLLRAYPGRFAPFDSTDPSDRIIARHYDAIIEEFKKSGKEDPHLLDNVNMMNEELAKAGLPRLFEEKG